MPATCSTAAKIILKNIAVDLTGVAVEYNQQVWDVVVVDNNTQAGNSRGIDCYGQIFCLLGGGDAVNGCGAHRSGVVDLHILQHRIPISPVQTLRKSGFAISDPDGFRG